MVITTYNFSKDKKSTKIPTSGGTQHTVVLKENTSIDNPTFILTHDGVPTFDYCQWIFGFYFVEDIKLQSKDVYEVNCKLDVLATYRNDILNSNQFVLRSASDYNINLVDDKMNPALNQTKTVYDKTINALSHGTYLVRVIGKTDSGTWKLCPYGIATYILTKSQIMDFIDAAYNNATFNTQVTSIQELGQLLKCFFFDPQSYILSINWLPLSIVGGPTHQIYLGWWGTGINAPMLPEDGQIVIESLPTPTRVFGDFRDFDYNYTRFGLSLPCVGVVELNPADVYAGIDVNISVEYLTGKLIYYIYRRDTNAIISKYKTNINCTIQIGGVTNGISLAGNSVGTIVTSGVKSLLPTQPQQTVIGNVGSQMEISNDHTFRLTRRIFGHSEYGTSRVGRPLHEMRTLSDLSGFCQCENAKLDTTAYGIIKDEIIDYMNEGFFIE